MTANAAATKGPPLFLGSKEPGPASQGPGARVQRQAPALDLGGGDHAAHRGRCHQTIGSWPTGNSLILHRRGWRPASGSVGTSRDKEARALDRERFARFRDRKINAAVRVAAADNVAILSKLKGIARLDVTEGPAAGASDKLRILIAFRPPHDEDISQYDWIHCAGAGTDHILKVLPKLEDDRPLMTRTIGRMGEQMGAYCLSYALADLQQHRARQEAQRAKCWDSQALAPAELFESNVLIVGTGPIGSGIAASFHPLAQSVEGLSRSGKHAPNFDRVQCWSHPGSLETKDFVIAALPSTNSTEAIIDAGFFSRLKEAVFINVGRGATVALDDLRDALSIGHVRHAVLDVFSEEPLPTDHWCWDHPKVTVTPHVSGITRPADTAEAFQMYWEALCRTGWPDLQV